MSVIMLDFQKLSQNTVFCYISVGELPFLAFWKILDL